MFVIGTTAPNIVLPLSFESYCETFCAIHIVNIYFECEKIKLFFWIFSFASKMIEVCRTFDWIEWLAFILLYVFYVSDILNPTPHPKLLTIQFTQLNCNYWNFNKICFSWNLFRGTFTLRNPVFRLLFFFLSFLEPS